MAPGIGIGISPSLRRGGGQSWSSYWATHFTGVPVEYGNNPLIHVGTCIFRQMLKVGDTYHIFEEFIDTDWYIRKRTSTDGLTIGNATTNLLAYGAPGSFDEKGQADPTVIYDGPGDWKMWFDAKNGSDVWDKLGYATSADGDTWVNQGAVVNRTQAWESNFIHHPAVIKYNNVYYMYYAAGNPYKIGVATSTDGITWTKYASNPVITQGSAGSWDSSYVRPSCPILINGLWHMWYWGYGGTTHKMGLATSPDLFTWTKVGNVLSPTGGAEGIYPVLREGTHPADKIVQLWFNGSASTFYLNYSKVTIAGTGPYIFGFTSHAANVYKVAFLQEPPNVYFNGVAGTKVTSVAAVNGEYKWHWASNVLYIYSTEAADVRYQIQAPIDIDGLAAVYALDETAGKAKDGLWLHHGTPSNVTQEATGAIFNSTNSKIDLGKNFAFERTDAFSVALRIKRTAVGGTNFLFSKGVAAPNYSGINVYITPANKIEYSLTATLAARINKSTNGTVTDIVNFTHICMTYDGSSQAAGLKMYINGSAAASTTIDDDLNASILQDVPFLIGSRLTSLGANGTIKDFRIYDKELTPVEVAALV